LTNDIDLKNSSLATELIQNRVLTEDDWERLQNMRGATNKSMASDFLLNILPRRGPEAFQRFIKSLMNTEGQDFIAKYLDQELVQQYETANVDQRQADGCCGSKSAKRHCGEPDDRKLVEILDSARSAYNPLTKVARQQAEAILSQNKAYRLTTNPRGMALILNEQASRPGSENDVSDLTKLFMELHFQVNISRDLNAKDIKSTIDTVCKADHSQYSAFVLVIMSHGVDGYVLGTDRQKVSVDEIAEMVGKCESL
jgi:hypothetical protein